MKSSRSKMTGGKPVAVESDGRTVWVNTEMNCIGRFGKNGIDIHRDLTLQRIQGECLYCTHEPTTYADWLMFKTKMGELYSVKIDDKHRPERLAPQ